MRKNLLSHHLLDISRKLQKNQQCSDNLPESITESISRVSIPSIQKLNLSNEHILIIARLFDKTISSSGRVEPLSLLREIYGDSFTVLNKMELMLNLIEKNILDCDNKKYLKIKRKDKKTVFKLDRSALLDVYIGFTPEFISFLLNNEKRAYHNEIKPFRSNREFIELWFRYVEALYDHRVGQRLHSIYSKQGDDALRIKHLIDKRLSITKMIPRFTKLIEDYDLSDDEQVTLMYVLNNSMRGGSTSEGELLSLLTGSECDQFTLPNVLNPEATLLREGLIVYQEETAIIFRNTGYEISPDIGAYLLNKKQHNDLAIIREIIKFDKLYSVKKPEFKMSNMVLPSDQKELVKQALTKYSNSSKNCLYEWGITEFKNQKSKVNQLRLFLYGPPGTGKTALANAIASLLRRLILCTDVSRILAQWVGESEKNLSKLFATYRKVCMRARKAPVLLFDEADQLLSKRQGVSHSADRMYNQMQNILLENLESFEGILIATTNLIDNIDEAFSRRFDLKLKLDIPDLRERKKIWQKLIPHELPLSNDVDLAYLARSYRFSGGQIKLVITNAAIAAGGRSEKSQKVYQSDLLKYAELERKSCFDSSTKKMIGF